MSPPVRFPAAVLAALAAWALAGCGDTGIVVTVVADDLEAPADIDTLDVLVTIDPADDSPPAVYELGEMPLPTLPHLFALERVGAPLGSVSIAVSAFSVEPVWLKAST